MNRFPDSAGMASNRHLINGNICSLQGDRNQFNEDLLLELHTDEGKSADCATRGLMPKELTTHNLWWRGPT